MISIYDEVSKHSLVSSRRLTPQIVMVTDGVDMKNGRTAKEKGSDKYFQRIQHIIFYSCLLSFEISV